LIGDSSSLCSFCGATSLHPSQVDALLWGKADSLSDLSGRREGVSLWGTSWKGWGEGVGSGLSRLILRLLLSFPHRRRCDSPGETLTLSAYIKSHILFLYSGTVSMCSILIFLNTYGSFSGLGGGGGHFLLLFLPFSLPGRAHGRAIHLFEDTHFSGVPFHDRGERRLISSFLSPFRYVSSRYRSIPLPPVSYRRGRRSTWNNTTIFCDGALPLCRCVSLEEMGGLFVAL